MAPRLKALPKRLETLAQRLGHPEGDRRAYDRQREAANDWRRWYRTRRWTLLREAIYARDHGTCTETGVLLIGRGNQPNAPVIHHKVPHNGDPLLFWDPDNLVTVSKAWHDSEGQKADREQGHW